MNTGSVHQEKQKLIWADNLRVVATICVIVLHVSTNVAQAYPSMGPGLSWQIWNLVNASVRFTVPVFVMLTGALMLPNNYSLGVFIRKRFMRIILPFLFWSVIYLVSHYIVDPENSRFIWIYTQMFTGVSYHMWYVYMIIGLLLFLPIINTWVKNCSEKEILYFLGIWIFVMLMNLSIFDKVRANIDWQYFTGYLGYLVLGYYLVTKSFNTKHLLTIAAALYIIGVGITAAGVYIETKEAGRLNEAFYHNFTLNVLMASIGIFLFFKNSSFNKRPTFISRVRNGINRYSYGIFLVHVLVLDHLHRLGISHFYIKPMIGVPLTCFLCLIISFLLVYLVNKLPFGKYISG